MTKKTLIAVITALGLVAVLGFVLMGRGGNDDQAELVAVFDDASPLVPGNVVKASGVDVGKITDVELRDGKAQVKMRIDRSVLPLHEDAKATITTQDLLGERFIRLHRGSPDAPVMSAMTIPTKNTDRVVDLQDVLNAVDTPTSVALSALLTETGEGLQGRGKQADEALAALAPAMKQTSDLAEILEDQNDLLTRLVDNTQPVASSVAADEGRQLDQLVDSATQSLEIVASERAALQAALARLPQTLRSARAALAELAGTAEPTRRTLKSLRPITDDLDDVSGELQKFADAADPALGSLPPVLERADQLLAEAAPVVSALRPAGKDLVPTSRSGAQLMGTALSGKSLTDLMEFAEGWSLATSDYDAISHYFKAMVPLSPNSIGDTAAGIAPVVPDDTAHGLPVPTAPEIEQKPREGAAEDDAIGGLLGGAATDDDSATGLSSKQESSLVEQFLGGLQ